MKSGSALPPVMSLPAGAGPRVLEGILWAGVGILAVLASRFQVPLLFFLLAISSSASLLSSSQVRARLMPFFLFFFLMSVPLLLPLVGGSAAELLSGDWERGVRSVVGYVLFLLGFLLLGERSFRRVSFEWALKWGGLLSALLSLAAIYGFVARGDQSEQASWEAIGRESGLFSDPNVLGICAALLIGWSASQVERLVGEKKGQGRSWWVAPQLMSPLLFWILYLALWLWLLVLSGSRSGVLLVGFYLTSIGSVLVYRMLKAQRLTSLKWILVPAFIFAVLTASRGGAALPGCASLPGALERVCQTVTSTEAWFSRELMWTAAIRGIADSPIAGLGAGQFYLQAPRFLADYWDRVGAWSDNPNSVYFSLLLDGGAIGLLALCIALSRFRISFDPHTGAASQGIFWGIVVVGALGSHFDSPVCALLLGWQLGALFHIDLKERKSPLGAASAIRCVTGGVIWGGSLLLTVWQAEERERGLYAWEESAPTVSRNPSTQSEPHWYRWTGKKARIRLDCQQPRDGSEDSLRVATLWVRALHPTVASAPVTISVQSPRNWSLFSSSTSLVPEVHEIKTSAMNRFEIPCADKASMLVALSVSRTWRPSDLNRQSGDMRDLGVMVFSRVVSPQGS